MWDSGIIASILEGKIYGSKRVPFNGGCTVDSRQVKEEEIFVAMRGEKTDGHVYIVNAFQAGAGIVIAESSRIEELGLPDIPEDKALITVRNPGEALQNLAGAWREEIDPFVVGITGSNGKTTTKDMIAAVLAQSYRVHKNKENFNNEIGLPLTILNAQPGTDILVLEMGMRGPKQIDALCKICRPSVGVITNIGTTHIELLGSQENIAEAKWELIDNLPEDGTAVLNAEDYYCMAKAGNTTVAQVYYGIKGKYAEPDVYALNIRASGTLKTIFEVCGAEEKTEVNLPLPGEHNVLDALAALAVGLIYGVSLKKGAKALKEFELSKMRLEILPGILNSVIISDVYNANPDSMRASLQVLAERGGQKTIAILGEMYELGDTAITGHQETGRFAAELKIKELITVGKLAENIAAGAREAGLPEERIHTCADCTQAVVLAKQLLEKSGPETWILVKGSRGMKMERVSSMLKADSMGHLNTCEERNFGSDR